MVSSIYAGRLGNNLFQKAVAIGYAERNGIKYCIDEEPSPRHMWPRPIVIKENGHAYEDIPFLEEWRQKHIILQGYWQSEKYFTHCREEVLKAFGYKWLHILPHTCSIHLRRGDYTLYPDKHPVIAADYLDQAIKYICEHTGVTHFLVFSDDIEYTKELIESRLYCGCSFTFSVGRTEKEDLELMSSCDHNIIANSTFSWWGAWLNQNPGKVVVSPSASNWFGPGNAHLETKDIIPDSWIKIKY